MRVKACRRLISFRIVIRYRIWHVAFRNRIVRRDAKMAIELDHKAGDRSHKVGARLLFRCVRHVFLTSVVCLLFLNCASGTRDMRSVWTQPSPPPPDLSTPPGFSITPTQAYDIALRSQMISLKHTWYLYADSQYYYVHDAFLGSSIGLAQRQGVRIDGKTGQIVKR